MFSFDEWLADGAKAEDGSATENVTEEEEHNLFENKIEYSNTESEASESQSQSEFSESLAGNKKNQRR